MSVTTNSCDNERIVREIEALQSKALCLQKQVCELRAKKGCVESSIDRQRCGALKQIQCYLQKLQNVHSFLTSDLCQMNNVGRTSKALMCDIENFMNTLKAEERRLRLATWCRNVGACCPQVTCYPDLCPPVDPCNPCKPVCPPPNSCNPCKPKCKLDCLPCDPCKFLSDPCKPKCEPNACKIICSVADSCNPCKPLCPDPCDPCKRVCPNPCNPCKPACPDPCDPCKRVCPNPCFPCKPACPDPCDPCKRVCPNPCIPCKPACPDPCDPCKRFCPNPCIPCKPVCPDPCDPCKRVCPDPYDPCKLLCAIPDPCKKACLVQDPCNPRKLIYTKLCPPCDPCMPFCDPCAPCSPCLPCGPCPQPCTPCDPCPPCGPSFPCLPCPPCGPCPPCLPCPPCGPCYPCYDMPSTKCLDVIPHNVGRGGSAFFDQLCSDLWKCAYLPTSCPQQTVACGTSWVRVIEVHQTGKYIKLVNTSCNKPEQIGSHYLIQQQLGGCPLSVFKFPPKVHVPPQATIKVWSCCNDPGLCKPPSDFVFKQLLRWSVGADVSTLLCRPNGQAVAWLAGCNVLCKDPCSTVPAPWFSCAGMSNVSTKKLR